VITINTIDVEVRDVPDPATIAAVERTVQNTYSHLVGAWHVRVSAADEHGNWDFRLSGAFGHHIAPFWATRTGYRKLSNDSSARSPRGRPD